jgi:RNA polymerase subunit RPABC4/transcription elongation factor Spt4
VETCKRCHIQVDNSLTHCPVCGGFVHQVSENDKQILYPTPNYNQIDKQTATTMHGFFAFPLLLALLLTLIIDLALIASTLGTTFLMTFIVFYVWILIYKTIYNRHGIGYIILWQLFGLSIITIVLAFVNQLTFDAWPLQYVVPILISTSNLLFIILATIMRKTDVILFQMLVSSLIGLGQFSVMVWVLTSSVFVPSLIALITSLISLTALLTYLRPKFVNYLQRWLHI